MVGVGTDFKEIIMQIVEHKKTKMIYLVIDDNVIDMTENSEQKRTVLYQNLDGLLLVMDYKNFYYEFYPVDSSDIKYVRR